MAFQTSACVETLYRELPFLQRFQAAKRDGFDFAEFWSWEDKDLAAVRAAAGEAGIGISAFNGDGPYSLIDDTQRTDYLAYLRASMEAAQRVGARSLTIHSNALGEGGRVLRDYRELSEETKLRALREGLSQCAALAEECGVNLNLEPLNTAVDHPGNYLTSTPVAAELVRSVGSPRLRVLYDVYHMYLNEGGFAESIRAYAPLFGHVHYADAPGRHEPGTGEIDLPQVLRCLDEAGYQGLIGFELFPAQTTARAAEAIRRALHH